nr:fibronectin type III-like domain-contianing protein [Paenibacillus sp. BIC5C1]
MELEPGEKRRIVFDLEERDFSYYNMKYNRWVTESGFFQIALGRSSRDIRITEHLHCNFGKEEVTFHKFSLLSVLLVLRRRGNVNFIKNHLFIDGFFYNASYG